MPGIGPNRKIYHITHVRNIPGIVADGFLRSDSEMISRGGPVASIGISTIKQRRLRLPVKCYDGDHVGEYVPFYFCPRSIMLYLLHKGNLPEVSYKEGQGPIVHLEADMMKTIAWAEAEGRRWAFSLSNAGAIYAEFRNDVAQLDEINWIAIEARDFRDEEIKEGKQAEFLVSRVFPWALVERIGVESNTVLVEIRSALRGIQNPPEVKVINEWYY